MALPLIAAACALPRLATMLVLAAAGGAGASGAPPGAPPPRSGTVIFGGDVVPHRDLLTSFATHGAPSLLAPIAPVVRAADLALINFETPASPAHPLTLREATQLLQSSNGDEVLQGIDALTRLGTPDVVPPLVELVHRGLPDELLETVTNKLGIIGQPAAIDELASLLRHRRAAVRREAVTALAQIRDPRVRALIESGLRDSDASVRGAAATALGAIGARQSVELLQRAFERGAPEAAEALGRVGDPAAANRLLDAVGHAQLSVLLPGFRRFLDRRDIADPVKLHIVEQLVSRSPTLQVKGFLQDWLDHLPPGARTPSRTRAELAVRQIQGSPSTTTPAAPQAPRPAGGAR